MPETILVRLGLLEETEKRREIAVEIRGSAYQRVRVE